MHKGVFIGVGSNVGDSIAIIEQAYGLIEANIGKLSAKSSFYETPPWGFETENNFVNTVIEITTELSVFELLDSLKKIEKALGRQEKTIKGYESRIIDLDIIDFYGEILNNNRLKLPHKYMHERLFVLIPLKEINNDWKHPVSGDNVGELIGRITPDNSIIKLS